MFYVFITVWIFKRLQRDSNLQSVTSWTNTQPVWLKGWVFVYELSICGLESRCSPLNFRYCACFKQGVPWDSGNYRVWIHTETRTWHDNNLQFGYYFIISFHSWLDDWWGKAFLITMKLRCSLHSSIMFVIGSTFLPIDAKQLSYSGISKFTLTSVKIVQCFCYFLSFSCRHSSMLLFTNSLNTKLFA